MIFDSRLSSQREKVNAEDTEMTDYKRGLMKVDINS